MARDLVTDLVVVSNRGPLSFTVDQAGALQTKRAGGGLAAVMGAAVAGSGTLWVAGALTDDDRRAASDGAIEAEGFRVELLTLDPEDQSGHYDVVSNATLWFLHHGLWDAPRRPRFDRHWWKAWDAYRRVNDAFAERVAACAPQHAIVLIQDYHLCLVGRRLAERRPDLTSVHFHHTPFASPAEWRALPPAVGEELLDGLTAHAACGFHSARWAAAFEATAAAAGVAAPSTFVSPAEADADDLRAVAGSPACNEALADFDAQVGDRKLIVRVDRIELSKNIARGFLAYDDLLRTRPELRERVVFGAFVYASREGLAEYQAYRQEVEGLINRINDEWSTAGWTPILYDAADDFPRSVAALRRFDVLLVNPIRDGLNLVAKEGMLLNERDGVLALSTESGVAAELGDHALAVHPFDIVGTSDVLHRALTMDAAERASRFAALSRRAAARSGRDWLDEQVRAAASRRA